MLYYLFISVPIILQIICIIHIIKNQKNLAWIFLIIFIPLLGCLVYFILEIVPHIGETVSNEDLQDKIIRKVVPQWKIKKLEENYDFSETMHNRQLLIDAYIENSDFDKALSHLLDCMDGYYIKDEHLVYQTCFVLFKLQQYEEALKYLDKLRDLNSDFENQFQYNLLYTQIIENIQSPDKVIQEYQRLTSHFSTKLELHYRFAKFLKLQDQKEQANHILTEMIKQKPYLKKHKFSDNIKWIRLAEREIS
ncbi:MAG: PLDc N-terminal domain-containing protein [Spirochaetes bacterium]|nr:PLDc N-terminal domain-containing protein [Spirochaetota bacterium]